MLAPLGLTPASDAECRSVLSIQIRRVVCIRGCGRTDMKSMESKLIAHLLSGVIPIAKIIRRVEWHLISSANYVGKSRLCTREYP